MHASDLQDKLRGVMAFAPTPFTSDDRLDGDGLARQVDFLVRSGAHVVVVCGGVGEFYSLEPGEYRDCMRIAVEGKTHVGFGGSDGHVVGLSVTHVQPHLVVGDVEAGQGLIPQS